VLRYHCVNVVIDLHNKLLCLEKPQSKAILCVSARYTSDNRAKNKEFAEKKLFFLQF
jgi:hypothetical protein